MIHIVKLIGRRLLAVNTMEFVFEKPPGFTFVAGQFADFSFIDTPENISKKECIHSFTIVSPPSAKEISLVTRLSDSYFKTKLAALSNGSEVKFNAPYGKFILHDDPTIPAVFLSGGIGVAPARSIILHAAENHLPHQFILFYSNHSIDSAAYIGELIALQKTYLNFKMVATITGVDELSKRWEGESGPINIKLLNKHLSRLVEPIYYVSGPPKMVQSMHTLLIEAGVSPSHIQLEEFTGY
jgi:ferredoxin-NADP reductase